MVLRRALQGISLVGLVVTVVGFVGSVLFVLWGVAFTTSTPVATLADPANWVGLGLFSAVVAGPWLLGVVVCLLGFVGARRLGRPISA
jgi:hypothetical protein